MNEETRLDAFEMKGLRRMLRVSWTAKKTNEWVLNKAGVKKELLDTVKARKLAYYGHTMRKQGSCLEKDVVMCGNWNVRQAMSQQVFRVTIFCIKLCFQSFSIQICRIVHHAVLKFNPCRNKPLPQASTCPYQ